MELSKKGIADRTAFEQKGYALPQFDREEMIAKTKKTPHWIHFGAGNIFRAFQANVMQELLNKGIMDTGLLVAEGFDYEIIEKMNRPHDDLSILVTLKADGSIEKTVVGSIAESLILDSHRETELARLKEVFESPSLQMASFTITEKGYSLINGKANFFLPYLPILRMDHPGVKAILARLLPFFITVISMISFRLPWSAWITAPTTAINYMPPYTPLRSNGQRIT